MTIGVRSLAHPLLPTTKMGTGSRLELLLVIASTTSACSMDIASSDVFAIKVDETAILSTLAGHRDSPAFVRVNEASYPTALGTGADINLYVSANGYAQYASINPDAQGSGINVPEGTLIIREVLEPNAAIKTLTLMYKGPKGYNPELGDFWFGVTDAAAKPALDTAGAPKLGRLKECFSCHIPRASDGYLFGVPLDVRPMAIPTPTTPIPPTTPLPPPPPPTQQPVCGDFACNGNESCATCSYDCGRCPPDDDGDDDGDDDDGDGDGKGGKGGGGH